MDSFFKNITVIKDLNIITFIYTLIFPIHILSQFDILFYIPKQAVGAIMILTLLCNVITSKLKMLRLQVGLLGLEIVLK